MQRMKQAAWIAVAALAVSGCASHKEESSIGFARRPQLKSSKTVYGSSRKGEQALEPPRILPETYYAAGRVFEQQGAPDKAIEQYRKAIAVNHEFTGAYARLGLMLSLTGEHEEATEAFSRAVELKPGSAILRNNLGFELLYLERWDESERHLREATQLDAKLTQAHINLGLLLGRTQRPEQAVEAFRQVLPEPDAYYNLGLLQGAQGQYPQALATFRHVLELNPKFTAAQRQLALVERKVVTSKPTTEQPTTDSIIEQTAQTTGSPTTGSITDSPTPATPTDAKPFADLSALIERLVSASTSLETNPTIDHTANVPSTPAPTIVETTPNTAPPSTAHLDPQAPGTSEPVSQRDTLPSTAIMPVETIEPTTTSTTTTTQTQEVVREEPTAQAMPTSQSFRSDLALDDVALAMNMADNQERSLEAIGTILNQPGSVPAQSEVVADAAQAPAPSQNDDQVVLVLGTSETKTEASGETVQSKRTPTPELSYESQRSMRTLDEMETSLQIIRNEIDCQKEFGYSVPDTSHPKGDVRPIEATFTPIEVPLVLEQRTDLWGLESTAPEEMTSANIGNAHLKEAEVIDADQAIKEAEAEEKQSEPGNGKSSPTLAAPTQKPRRHRWFGSRNHR